MPQSASVSNLSTASAKFDSSEYFPTVKKSLEKEELKQNDLIPPKSDKKDTTFNQLISWQNTEGFWDIPS